MTAGAPWSVKGIDPKAREVAKDLARRSGMTLGEWLNRVILEDDVPEEVFSEADFHDRTRRLADPPRLRPAPAAAAGRADDLARMIQALDRLTERIEAGGLRDAVGPRSEEALRAIYGGAEARTGLVDEVAARLAERLAEAEARTGQALDDLRAALAALDARLRAVEGGAPMDVERRLDSLAADLAERVDAVRAEAAAGLQATPGSGIEARLAEMSRHVAAAEQRSARAIERMGQDVLSLAEALNRRLASAEQLSAEAVEQVGGEMARVGAVVEGRLTRAEQAQAEALERLGAEIGRVTERLTDKVALSERRTAQAIEDVGDQVARVTERIEARHERLSGDFAERLRQSEARTARLLAEARESLETRLSAARDRLAAAGDDAPPAHAFGPELFARAEPAPADLEADLEADAGPTWLNPPPPPADEADFTPIADPVEDIEPDDDPDDAGARPLSTREVIQQARLAARAESAGAAGPQVAGERRGAARPGARRVFSGLGFRAAARPPSTWQTALMLAGGAAFLSVGAAGVVLMQGEKNASVMAEVEPAPRAAVALAPQPLSTAAPAAGEPAAAPAPRPQPAADYAAAVRDIETGQAGGLARLKLVAEAGYPPAQFYLAKLYENGLSGVVKNPAEARKWTERAADGGDRSAMHNLALYYFRGEGGPQDLAKAAKLFKQAAEAGVIDSQYNLGLLYEAGSGVDRNLTEAYKWFTIAGAGGDAQARANAVALQPSLPPAAVAAADRAAAAYRPRDPAAPGSAGGQVAAAQRVLGKLGYFKGPADGAASSQFRLALQKFQHDHRLSATGALDTGTAAELAVFTR